MSFFKTNFRISFSVEETKDKSLCVDIQLTFVRKPSNEMSRFHTYIVVHCSVMSNSPRPHGLKHTRLPCPSPSPGVCSNSCSLSQGCHPTISSSVVPFSFCLQPFPASGSFLINQLFISGSHTDITQ